MLSKIVSSDNLFRIIDNLKDLLLKIKNNEIQREDSQKFASEIVKNIFYMLENKAKDLQEERISESIKLLLILDDEIPQRSFSSLLNLIGESEEYQVSSLNQIWDYFVGNWKQRGFFMVSVYLLGEYSEIVYSNKLKFTMDQVLGSFLEIYQHLSDTQSINLLLNSITKILAKHEISFQLKNSF